MGPGKSGYVDVLRFQVPLSVYVHTAAGPEFVDRPPVTGTGFADWSGGVVPWTVVPASQALDVKVIQSRLPSLAFRG